MKKPNLPEKLTEISKESIISAVRIYLSGFGPIGVAFDEMFFGIGERIRSKRLEKIIAEIGSELSKIKYDSISKASLDTEEFHDLLLGIFIKSTQTRHEEKIKIYSKILAGFIEYPDEIEEYEDFSGIISNLSIRDIKILKVIGEIELDIEKEKAIDPDHETFYDLFGANKIVEKMELSLEDISFSLSRLSSFGLLKEFYDGSILGNSSGGEYKTTNKLQSLKKFLIVE